MFLKVLTVIHDDFMAVNASFKAIRALSTVCSFDRTANTQCFINVWIGSLVG